MGRKPNAHPNMDDTIWYSESLIMCQQMVNIAERKRGKQRANENNPNLQEAQDICNSEQLIATQENREQPYFPDCKSVGAYKSSLPHQQKTGRHLCPVRVSPGMKIKAYAAFLERQPHMGDNKRYCEISLNRRRIRI
jgi:hypothetical protein